MLCRQPWNAPMMAEATARSETEGAPPQASCECLLADLARPNSCPKLAPGAEPQPKFDEGCVGLVVLVHVAAMVQRRLRDGSREEG